MKVAGQHHWFMQQAAAGNAAVRNGGHDVEFFGRARHQVGHGFAAPGGQRHAVPAIALGIKDIVGQAPEIGQLVDCHGQRL